MYLLKSVRTSTLSVLSTGWERVVGGCGVLTFADLSPVMAFAQSRLAILSCGHWQKQEGVGGAGHDLPRSMEIHIDARGMDSLCATHGLVIAHGLTARARRLPSWTNVSGAWSHFYVACCRTKSVRFFNYRADIFPDSWCCR